MPVDVPPPILACALIAAHEESAAVHLQRADAARRRGDFAAAECEVEAALSDQPRDADAWVQLGFIRSALGDSLGARQAFTRALDIAPHYDDAKFGLAQLAYRSGDINGAEAWLQDVDSSRRSDPEFAMLRQAVTDAQRQPVQWRADAFASYSVISDDLDPWRETGWSLGRRSGRVWIGGSIDYVERFGRSDVFAEARTSRSADWGWWSLALGGGPDADFMPEAAVRAELSSPEAADWSVGGSITLARYAVGQIDRLGLSAAHRFDEGVRATVQTIVVRDEFDDVRAGYGLGAFWRATDRLELSIKWADAPESSEGFTIDVRSLGVGVAVDMGSDLRLRIGLLGEDRGAFDRFEFSFAVARTF